MIFPVMGPITNVPLSDRKHTMVPYYATFYLVIERIDDTHTKLIVRTISARVQDGRQYSIHAGGNWAHNERIVQPIKAEEENIILAVSNAIPHVKK